ncbi:hypothetical protein TURU_127381 [Turdus rufiventris]|nr:hypothetical protein TURU_127381 [Turdus rufiventris]
MEIHSGAEIHLQPLEDRLPEQVDTQRSKILAGPLAPWGEEPVAEQIFWQELVTTWEGPTPELFVNNCSLGEGFRLEKLVEDALLWESPHAAAGEQCERFSPWGEGAAETAWDDLTAVPIPSPL